MPAAGEALPGRQERMAVPEKHFVFGTRLVPPFPAGSERAVFGMGCFWGAEKKFWETGRVFTTAVGYAGGKTLNPTYREVCSGLTGHTEVVLVVFEPCAHRLRRAAQDFLGKSRSHPGYAPGQRRRHAVPLRALLGKRRAAGARARARGKATRSASRRRATGQSPPSSRDMPEFYYAEDYHQQYLAKNPGGYCGIGGTGVACPVGTKVTSASGA